MRIALPLALLCLALLGGCTRAVVRDGDLAPAIERTARACELGATAACTAAAAARASEVAERPEPSGALYLLRFPDGVATPTANRRKTDDGEHKASTIRTSFGEFSLRVTIAKSANSAPLLAALQKDPEHVLALAALAATEQSAVPLDTQRLIRTADGDPALEFAIATPDGTHQRGLAVVVPDGRVFVLQVVAPQTTPLDAPWIDDFLGSIHLDEPEPVILDAALRLHP